MKYSLEKRKDGLTSCYAMHCGYIDEYKTEGFNGIILTRWHEGGTVYHVQAYDHKSGKRLFWETFEFFEESARFFKKQKTKNYAKKEVGKCSGMKDVFTK